jgi:hypothetical protein
VSLRTGGNPGVNSRQVVPSPVNCLRARRGSEEKDSHEADSPAVWSAPCSVAQGQQQTRSHSRGACRTVAVHREKLRSPRGRSPGGREKRTGSGSEGFIASLSRQPDRCLSPLTRGTNLAATEPDTACCAPGQWRSRTASGRREREAAPSLWVEKNPHVPDETGTIRKNNRTQFARINSMKATQDLAE